MNVLSDISVRLLRDGGVPVTEVNGSDLPDPDKTFDCGQCFRFEKSHKGRHESEWEGVAYGKKVSFAKDGDRLYIYNSTLEEFDGIWRRYLDLDTDYFAVDRDILSRSESEALKNAVSFGHGIRILRQEPWETIFIGFFKAKALPAIEGLVRIRQIVSVDLGHGNSAVSQKTNGYITQNIHKISPTT